MAKELILVGDNDNTVTTSQTGVCHVRVRQDSLVHFSHGTPFLVHFQRHSDLGPAMRCSYTRTAVAVLFSFSITTASHLRTLKNKKEKESKFDDTEKCVWEDPHYRCFRNWDGNHLTALCPNDRIEANNCACRLEVESPKTGEITKCSSCHIYEYKDDWAVDMDCSNVFKETTTASEEEATTPPTFTPTTLAPTVSPSSAPSQSPTLAPSPAPTPAPTRNNNLPNLYGSSRIQPEESLYFYEDAISSVRPPTPVPAVLLTQRNSRTRPPSLNLETWPGGHR